MKEPMTNNEMPMTARLRMQWACALFYFGLAAPGVAQSLNSQDNSGIQPFQTYSQDKESVNLATGSLNLSIPLLHLPGRAGHDVDVALSYNNQSVLYPTLGSHPVINTAPGGGGQPIPGLTQYVMGWTASSNYGWTTNFPSVTFQTLSSGAPAHYPQFTGSCFGAPSLSDVRGQQMTFGVALFGCSAGLTPTNTTNVSPYLTTAADDQGSGVIADMSAPAGPTFFYPDGNRLVIPAAPAGQNLQELNPTTIFDVDRNGNTNTYTSTATNQVITDTLGRLVTFTWPSGGSPSDGVTNAIGASSIAYNNSNGQNQTIQLIYGGSPQAASGELDQPGISLQSSAGYGIVPQTASPGVIYIQWEGYGGNINNPNVNLSQNPLSAILLPNGQSYTFQYDAFGDLIKITYPDGGYTRYDYQKLQHGSAMVINNLQQVFQQDIMQVVAKHVCTSAATQIGATTAPVGNNCPIAEETTTYTPSSAITTNNWNTGNTSNTVVTADGTSVAHTFMAVTPSAPVYQFGAYESMYQAAPELAETTTAAGGTFLKSVSNTYEPDNAHLQTKVTTLDNGNTITEQWTYQQTAVTGAAFTQYPAPTGTPQIPGNEVPCTGYCNYTIPPSTGAFAGVDMVWNVVNYSVTDWNNNVLKTVADTWQTPVFSPNLPFLTSQKLSETIYQGSSTTPLSISQYLYDSYSAYPLTSSGAIQHGIPGMGFGSSFQSRGNMTAIKKWRNWDGSWITSQMQYDDAGNKIKDIDPNGNITSYSYADAWLNGSCASAGGGAVAYPTTVTNAMGQSTTELYNSCTGTAGIKTDANGQSTSYSYDTSDRVVDVLYPETYPGTATHAETKTCYSDSKSCQGATASSNYVLVSSNITPSLWAISETDLDGIGRKTAQKTLSDPYGAMEVDTSYDMMERLQSVSNPYRPSAGGTTGSTTYTYDGLSRQLTETTPDNHQLLSTYSGTTTHSWDETQREWTHVTDALNRLTEVLEPDSSGSDTVATQYQYDSLGNLTRVDQWGGPIGSAGDRVRTFTYDSLSQLLTSYNPEAGTTCYGTGNSSSCTPGYDLDGNLLVQTDARGISTNFSVDSLNRVTSRSYSDGTASACFIYDNASSDPSGAHRVGRLLFEWTQHGTCPGNASGVPSNAINYRVVNSYDPKGQVTNETQCPSSPCSTAYTFPYTYDLAGNVTSWAAGLSNTPTLTSTFDAANRLSNVTSSMSDNAHPGILFRADSTTATTVGVPYGPFGMLNAESAVSNSTNQAAITTTHSYDTRGRILSEINNDAAGSSTPSSGQININFAEQQKTITTSGGASTGSFTITGSDLPVTPCPSNAGYAPNCLDLGVVVLVIINPVNSSAISYNAEYVAGTSGSTLAQMLAGQINGNSSSLVTASANNSVVSLTSKATSGANNYGLYSVVQSITTQNTSSTVVGGPSYVVSASGPTMTSGGGGSTTTIYDTGTVTATVGTTTAQVAWNQSSTSASIASSLASALSSASGGTLQTSVNGGSINIQSALTGSYQNSPIGITITHDASDFPQIPVGVTTQGMSGGSNTALYSFSIPSGNAGYAANGDLVSVTDSVMGTWSFGYDQINRMTSASVAGGGYAGLGLTWGYDAWGNRLSQTVSPGSGSQTLPSSWWSAYSPLNQSAASSVASYGYTAAGHVTYDGLNRYYYDGDGRLCAIQNTINTSITGYTYDAEGIRVTKGSQTATNCTGSNGFAPNSTYLVDLGGNQVTELNSSGNWVHSNVFAAGRLIGTYDSLGLHFHFTDILGTRRAQASSSGSLEEICTSLPYGDQLICTPTNLSTADDATEQHFTGKERDSESGLDYFGARYYSSTSGRFISPDWSSSTVPVPYADLNNPQSLNLYAYVQNNPVTHQDLTGHDPGEDSMASGLDWGGAPYAEPSTNSACHGCSYELAAALYEYEQRIQAATSRMQDFNKTQKSITPSTPAQQQSASPLTDKNGNVVQGANGKPALIPGGFDVGAVVQAGKSDKDMRKWAPMVGTADTASDLANFRRGGKWDLQRLSGNFDPRFIDSATILIGMYAAASGLPRSQILSIENDIARGSTYAKGTVMDSTYTHLPVRNVMNTDTGMRLVQSGAYVP